jgi:hypothetical protein
MIHITGCHSGIFLKQPPLSPFSKGESEGFPTPESFRDCGNDTVISIGLPELSCLTSAVPLCAGVCERPVDHLVVAALIDADVVAACAAYSVAIGRAIAVVPVDPFLVASQDFSLADFVIPPEFFPAGGAPQHQHTGTLPPHSSGFFERIQHFSRFQ